MRSKKLAITCEYKVFAISVFFSKYFRRVLKKFNN